ncbi:MAG: C40 family peptidase [Rhodoferax sp.]|uniref:C40 family peptidase n=1 Tax=Rhodoferax sp. TaxID=50421 RepID=UPI002ACE203F|nr:C40 family peptidase [Rhodoferax sp.]MDZ7891196.1 C40 family peptidase [Rhodoferax sp.]
MRALCALLFASAVLVLAGCSSAPTTPSSPAAVPSPAARLTLDQANDVTVMAIGLVGTPYRYGGNTPASGFDCSGLISYVYQQRAGVVAPRTTGGLIDWGTSIPAPSLRTGDLVVFAQNGRANHAGIYVGEGRFVHAPSTGGTVRLDRLNSSYWSKQQVSYRRP